MILNPYLGFNGNCREAFEFYEKTLGGKLLMMLTNGDAPMAADIPSEDHGRVMHARLEINGQLLMGGDGPKDCSANKGFRVSINTETPEQAEQLFAALSDGGTIQMPIEKTFWAVRFGMLTDKFGIPWMINCEQAA
jgi:PhnB protein